MLIRFGHEITVTCERPTPLVCLVAPHQERLADLALPEVITTNPPAPIHSYFDLFGNLCRRFTAPAGQFTFSSDCTLRDSGQLDPYAPDAAEVPINDLPDDTLVYLMGSRYCETDKLMDKAVGQVVTLVRTNPATGAETRETATILANNGGAVVRIGDRIEVLSLRQGG